MRDTLIEVWNSGGGTQSTAIAVLIAQGKLPKPDIALIADTGRESRATWDYLEKVVNPGLEKVGVRILRIKSEKWSTQHGFMDRTGNHLLIPAYTDKNGKVSKMSNFCTDKWKVECLGRWLSQIRGLTKSDCRKWIGFTVDEPRRWSRMMKGKDYQNGLIRFPLIHDFQTTRAEAIKLVEGHGWPKPPRSACWMCPHKKDEEWVEMRDNRPDEFNKAIAFEEEMRAVDGNAWLHRNAEPLKNVEFDMKTDALTEQCDSGECFL